MDDKILALYKYWITVESIREVLFGKSEPKHREHAPVNIQEYAEFHYETSRMSVMYGLIFVVIEGYKELNLKDSRIEELLSEKESVKFLRRYRNSVFHYQKELITEKEFEFISQDGHENWIRDLHYAFSSFFDSRLHVEELYKYLMEEVVS